MHLEPKNHLSGIINCIENSFSLRKTEVIETNKQTSYSTLTSLTQERAHASSTKGRGLS